MKKEYKKAIKKIINSNKLHNKANPFFNHTVGDAQYDLVYNSSTGKWDLLNKQPLINNEASNNIIVILESPHIDEFDGSGLGKMALMNDDFFKKNFGQLINGSIKLNSQLNQQTKYKICLINAIQFQCSLGLPTEYYRDFVFLYYWRRLHLNFEKRLMSLINPNTYAIVNLCTKGSHRKCLNLYNSVSNQKDYMYKSCCNKFIVKIYDSNSSCKSLQDLVGESIDAVIKTLPYNVPTTEGTHPSSWCYGGKIR